MTLHTNNGASPDATAHESSGHVSPVYPVPPFSVAECDGESARCARKRRARDAIFAAHGTLKAEYLASLLGHASKSFAQRCLSYAHRSEFSAAHLARLGVAL